MMLELFILFEFVMIGFFFTSILTKQEVFWICSVFLSGILMIVSYSVEIVQNNQLVSHSFPYMMGINLFFFIMSVLLLMLDLFDKYGIVSSFENKRFK